jgi:adenosylcobinamide-GDP ribazoletransferase
VTRAVASLRLALTFLTVVPVGGTRAPTAPVPPLGAAAPWFPVVGAAVGAAAGAIAYAAEPTLGPLVAAVLAVIAMVVATGALHQDGLADCADGLGVRGDRARRLAVMRDPTVGTFGVLALVAWLVLLVAALAGLERDDALRALVVAGAVGRWAALLHAALSRPARPDGLGSGFHVGAPGLAVATVLAAAAALLVAGVGPGLGALAAAVIVAAVTSDGARRLVGGRTGDTLGATVALTEVVVVVVLLGFA